MLSVLDEQASNSTGPRTACLLSVDPGKSKLLRWTLTCGELCLSAGVVAFKTASSLLGAPSGALPDGVSVPRRCDLAPSAWNSAEGVCVLGLKHPPPWAPASQAQDPGQEQCPFPMGQELLTLYLLWTETPSIEQLFHFQPGKRKRAGCGPSPFPPPIPPSLQQWIVLPCLTLLTKSSLSNLQAPMGSLYPLSPDTFLTRGSLCTHLH